MREKIYVNNSRYLCYKWDSYTLEQIADEIECDSFELEYEKNIIGDFFGTILLNAGKTTYYFHLSDYVTHSRKKTSELGDCVGKYFLWDVLNKYGNQTNKINSGFVICDASEKVEPYQPGNSLSVPEIPNEVFNAMMNKNLYEAYNDDLIKEILSINSKFLFRDENSDNSYVVIDDYKVYVSNNVNYLTEEQLKRIFDRLTFHEGSYNDGRFWRRLGLPKELKFISSVSPFID